MASKFIRAIGAPTQYLYHRGPEIGVVRYRSERGVGVFWSFRFEIT